MPGQTGEKICVIWRPLASRQWERILEFFVTRNGSVDYSNKLDEKLKKRLEQLRHNPKVGQKTKRKGVRRIIVENYAVLFRATRDAVEVKTIVDARRNVPLD